jgi:hypothetical protein
MSHQYHCSAKLRSLREFEMLRYVTTDSMLCVNYWVVPRRVVFNSRRFETLCL